MAIDIGLIVIDPSAHRGRPCLYYPTNEKTSGARATYEEGEDGEARGLEVPEDDDVLVGAERLERLLGEQRRPLLGVLRAHLVGLVGLGRLWKGVSWGVG